MNYDEALAYIQSFTDYEKTTGYLYAPENFDLRRVLDLLHRLGDPHLQAKTVHVAGSKGKGSTASLVASVLREAGYRTGLFTSPHLLDFRERIRVDGEMIGQEEMARHVERMQPHVDAVHQDAAYGRLTTFELITALGFMFFAEQSADFQVMEAGLGGRLDATNVVSPLCCAITAISLDHTAILGDTVEKIATEKAGIIKEGRPVVSSPQVEEALAVIERTCQQRQAPLTIVGRDVRFGKGRPEDGGQAFSVETRRQRYDLWIPLLGAHQVENASTAIGVLEALCDSGVNIGGDAIKQGFRRVVWPGRLQVLKRRPLLVVDGAHNGESTRRLVQALQDNFAFGRLTVVLGTSSDKDIEGIFRALLPAIDCLIVTRSQHPRAAAAEYLAARWAKLGKEAIVTANVGDAIALAIAGAGDNDLICVTGSLFVVADALAACGVEIHFRTAGR